VSGILIIIDDLASLLDRVMTQTLWTDSQWLTYLTNHHTIRAHLLLHISQVIYSQKCFVMQHFQFIRRMSFSHTQYKVCGMPSHHIFVWRVTHCHSWNSVAHTISNLTCC